MMTVTLIRNRPTVPEVQPLVDAYYALPNCGVGGGLHIVLDDNNYHDDDIRYCIESAPEHWCGEVEATRLLGRVLLLMSQTQRRKLQSSYSGMAPFGRDELLARCRVLLARVEDSGG